MKFYANLKCNHTRKSFENYALKLNEFLTFNGIEKTSQIAVFPPSSAFYDGELNFRQGTQNFYPARSGNFTGEIGLEMLEEFGINSVLIGHSERRFLGEKDSFLKAKFEFAKKQGFEIVFCVGESDVVHMNASTKSFLKGELEILDLEYENLIIAYEPIWAIGSGKSASGEYIAEILEFLRGFTKAPLLYGGSVNSQNIAEISKISNCDGVLIGSASFKIESFLELLEVAGFSKEQR